MKLKELTKALCELEGLKVEVSYGNMREIVGIISDLLYAEHLNEFQETISILMSNGKRRARKK